jgi:hypothetical protein
MRTDALEEWLVELVEELPHPATATKTKADPIQVVLRSARRTGCGARRSETTRSLKMRALLEDPDEFREMLALPTPGLTVGRVGRPDRSGLSTVRPGDQGLPSDMGAE